MVDGERPQFAPDTPMVDGERSQFAPAQAAVARDHIPPRTELEKILSRIWADILAVDRIGVHDDFFALGGHSQLLVRMQLKINEALKMDVPVTTLFEFKTIDALARHLKAVSY